jgi:fumarate reductase subunit D
MAEKVLSGRRKSHLSGFISQPGHCASTFTFVLDIFPAWLMMMEIYHGPAMMKFIVAWYLSFFGLASIL